jgi:hypothetical protein
MSARTTDCKGYGTRFVRLPEALGIVVYVDGEWRAWPEGEVEASDCAVIVLRLLNALEELGR